MNTFSAILRNTFVKTYYRQNAGLFVFIYTLMFGIVGELDGFSELNYHYALISGLLSNDIFFLLTLFLWLLYAEKCLSYIINKLQSPDHSFLNMLSRLDNKNLYSQMFWVQCLLFLPVLTYSLAIIGVAFYKGFFIHGFIVLFYNVALCMLSAGCYKYYIQHPGKDHLAILQRLSRMSIFGVGYWNFLMRYFITKHKLLIAGIKLFSCSMLFLMCRNLTAEDYDLRMPFLFYCFGLLGHGVIIHKLREQEETRMTFYRSLPVSLLARFTQYAWLYLLLLIPEIITILSLAPGYLHYSDAYLFIICSYSLVLLLNSILFIRPFKIRDYLKIVLVIFFVIYFFVLAQAILWITIIFLLAALYLFFSRYYKYN